MSGRAHSADAIAAMPLERVVKTGVEFGLSE